MIRRLKLLRRCNFELLNITSLWDLVAGPTGKQPSPPLIPADDGALLTRFEGITIRKEVI